MEAKQTIKEFKDINCENCIHSAPGEISEEFVMCKKDFETLMELVEVRAAGECGEGMWLVEIKSDDSEEDSYIVAVEKSDAATAVANNAV